jgi:membrane fusion protein, peptide pheromone/bacteriocin exporter
MGMNEDKELTPFPQVQNSLECYLFKINTSSRAIYWIIISFISILLTSLPFIYVDVSVRSSGYFKSAVERQTIYVSVQGKVTFTAIKEGEKVVRGDTLLIIDTEATKVQLLSLESQLSENSSSMNDLEMLTSVKASDLPGCRSKLITPKYMAELLSFEKLLMIQESKTRKAKADYERSKVLFEGNTIPKVDYENSMYSYRVEDESLSRTKLQQISVWQADLTKRMEDQAILQAEHQKLMEELDNRVITAPLSGEIIKSSDVQPGTKIFAGQEIATLSPEGDLVAICLVSPKDIGLLHEEQDVMIHVDAYNFNEWGTLKGKIKNLPDDVILDSNSNAWFLIECHPEKEFLTLKNGFKGHLRKGMTFNALIFLTRRSLFNLLFDKADKWLNPNSKSAAK